MKQNSSLHAEKKAWRKQDISSCCKLVNSVWQWSPLLHRRPTANHWINSRDLKSLTSHWFGANFLVIPCQKWYFGSCGFLCQAITKDDFSHFSQNLLLLSCSCSVSKNSILVLLIVPNWKAFFVWRNRPCKTTKSVLFEPLFRGCELLREKKTPS